MNARHFTVAGPAGRTAEIAPCKGLWSRWQLRLYMPDGQRAVWWPRYRKFMNAYEAAERFVGLP